MARNAILSASLCSGQMIQNSRTDFCLASAQVRIGLRVRGGQRRLQQARQPVELIPPAAEDVGYALRRRHRRRPGNNKRLPSAIRQSPPRLVTHQRLCDGRRLCNARQRLLAARLSRLLAHQGYAEVVQELLPNATTAPALNRTLGANWFNWRNSSGQMHQVWRVPQPSC